jgi:hypothetical protein
MRRSSPRRRLLACLAAAPALGAAAAAHAFRLEPAGAGLRAEYGEGACAAPPLSHDALRAELDRLAPGPDGRPLPEALARELERLSRCPFCGCSVAAAEGDHGEAAPAGRG